MSTLLLYAPATEHTQTNHPESHARMEALLPTLEKDGVLADLTAVSPIPATDEQLHRIHSPALIRHVHKTAANGGGLLDQGDTYATHASYDLAALAVGGCCLAVDRIMTGQVANGLALVRPPGHHAEANRISGFCLFNNIAAAARQAQVEHGIERILILDFDVHHGNGTEDIFYPDGNVLFMSLHLYIPYYFYPGSGRLSDIGTGLGRGYNLNVPLPPYVGDQGYARIFDEVILPKAREFQPELILVSAGFDAHWQDPLAVSGLSLQGYAQMCRDLMELAAKMCNGRILFVLEGGYQHEVLANGVLNLVYALLGQDQISDPLGFMSRPEQDVTDLLLSLKQSHLLL